MPFLSKLHVPLRSWPDIRSAEAHTVNTTGEISEERIKENTDLSLSSCAVVQLNGTSTVLVSQFF